MQKTANGNDSTSNRIMALSQLEPTTFDRWLLEETPESPVVVSSRARIARNLPNQPFTPRANPEQLSFIARRVDEGVTRTAALANFMRVDVDKSSAEDRCFLRESHLISNDLEKGGGSRLVYLSPERDASLMVNEEDHLRLTTLKAGFRLADVYDRLVEIEQELEKEVVLAFSEEFGYLTACPTNTGTGLRLSVMVHLPALTMLERVEVTLADLNNYGLVVRGAYGEHTESMGDLYQISNEITLGKSEEEILAILQGVVQQIIDQEMDARENLLRDWHEKLEDVVCRAMGVLSNARRIDSLEAISLLSRIRLGLGHPWGITMSHPALSRLFVQIQPAHLQCSQMGGATPEDRDQLRAALLRSNFKNGASEN
jgi:protein arginine kinase